MSYRLNDELSESVARHKQHADFMAEVAVLRGLLERTLAAEDDPSKALAKCEKSLIAISKMSQLARRMEIESGELLPRETLELFGKRLVEVIIQVLRENLSESDCGKVVDILSGRINNMFETNPKQLGIDTAV